MKLAMPCPRRHLQFGLLLCLCGLLLLLGCNAKNQGSQDASSNRPRIALIMKSLANEFFSTMADGARAHQAANPDGFELTVTGIQDERDVSRQVALVREMIAQQYDAIVIAPADSQALAPVLKQAMDAGVVVINIDNRLDASVLSELGITIPFVGPDNREGALRVGQELAGHLEPGSEVAILEGIETSFNSQQRTEGFRQAMLDAGMTLVTSQSAMWEMERAKTETDAIMTAHPNLKAIMACNDSMALGVLASLRARGLVGQVQIVGFDNIEAVRESVKEGTILATADQHGDQLAVFGIDAALQILESQTVPEDRQTPVDLVTAESLGVASSDQ